MLHTHEISVTDDVVRKTYVSWAQDEPGREWQALVHLDRHAPGLAPRPIARLEVDDRPVIDMALVAGLPLTEALSREQTSALAGAFLRLFAVPVPADLRLRAHDPTSFRERFRWWLEADHDWDACQDPDGVRHAVDAARRWLVRHPPTPDWIDDPVIALGDGNLDNVLWDGRACRLVDWEEYGVSDLSYEVADVLEHASSRLERRLDSSALLAELALTADQRERVEHHRRTFACFWLAMLLPGRPGWHRNPPGSTEDQASRVLELVG
ncbi:phosphotransferase family protein [Nocardioides hwasunensis]|uniref:Aminoglycoside phosphotransferase family protein n=1 Tax=Nocardioides hwasunensis TaxID=397258 RepID=A0ABR8MF39_9ACTN|nr:aminoglycoside phosphotransferase family protein [Nocardioides hwasunensis]MBD3914713.1 aminoglycoside phosphotransferase family protein [Nocardioides hwasunensis]